MIAWNGQQFSDGKAARAAMLAGLQPAAVAVLEPEPAEPAAEPAPPVQLTQTPRPVKRESLVARHRPRTLSQVVGQPAAVAQLRQIVQGGRSASASLSGASGTGKTSAAWAVAGDLGCDLDAQPSEWGGVHQIASGDHNADTLRGLWDVLWTKPFSGSGWNVLIVNETEDINPTVERLWMDRLEDMPPRCIIIFTTNHPESLPERFIDRCDYRIDFDSSSDKLTAAARGLAASIWREETGGEIPADALADVLDRATSAGRLSFRRVVQALVPLIAGKAGAA